MISNCFSAISNKYINKFWIQVNYIIFFLLFKFYLATCIKFIDVIFYVNYFLINLFLINIYLYFVLNIVMVVVCYII